MEQYKPKESDFIESLKGLVVGIMFKSEIIPQDLKGKVMKEIRNMNCDRLGGEWSEFDTKEKMLEHAVSFSIDKWVHKNLELSSLWKDVAIANASHSNDPSDVANKALVEFKKEFSIDTKK